MVKKIGVYMNVALVDYDDSMQNHLVELMKDSIREQAIETILEDTWEIAENKRVLYKNEDGAWEAFDDNQPVIVDTREVLEVMTVSLSVKIEDFL